MSNFQNKKRNDLPSSKAAYSSDIRYHFHQASGGLNGIDSFGEQMADLGRQITRLRRWIKSALNPR